MPGVSEGSRTVSECPEIYSPARNGVLETEPAIALDAGPVRALIARLGHFDFSVCECEDVA